MTVLIADDHEIFLDSLSLLISTFSTVTVVGHCTSGPAVLAFLAEQPVDLLITDYKMTPMTGIDLTLHLRQSHPAVRVLMLSVSEEDELMVEAFRAGVWGYVMKRAGKDELRRATETIAAGQKYFSESVVSEIIRQTPGESLLRGEIPLTTSVLSEREIEIVRLIARELSSNQIAERLFIALRTVETHRHNILRKLGVKNTAGILKFAIRHGLV